MRRIRIDMFQPRGRAGADDLPKLTGVTFVYAISMQRLPCESIQE